MNGVTATRLSVWKRWANILFETRGFFLILSILLGTGSILAFTSQGQDLVRTVTDNNGDHSSGFTWQVFWLCASVFLLGCQAWFWARIIVQEKFKARSAWGGNTYLVVTPRILSTVPFILLFVALQNVQTPSAWLAWVLAALGIGLLVFLWFRLQTVNFVKMRTHSVFFRAAATEPASPVGSKKWPTLRSTVFYGSLVVALIAMTTICADPVTIPMAVGPAAVVLIGAALIIPVLIWLMLLGDAYHIRVVETLVIIGALVSLVVDNHRIRLSATDRKLQQEAINHRPTLAQAYTDWRKNLGETGPGPIPIIFVASAGGASRAGYWTSAVLSKLEQETGSQFSKHVFAISSISGGSLGVGGFLSVLRTQPQAAIQGNLSTAVSDFVGRDYLSPALAGGVFPDLLQRVVPVSILPDRAWSLERGWEDGWASACATRKCGSPDFLSQDFLSLWSPGTTRLPIWLIGGALQEDGRPILTSSLNFEDRIDAWDFHLTVGAEVRLSTAILNGARFPLVSPAGTIDDPKNMSGNAKRIHIVDGGYFDAAGVEVLRDLAQSLLTSEIVPAGDKLQPIFVLITNDGRNPPLDSGVMPPQGSKPVACRGPSKKEHCPGVPSLAGFAPDMLGPIEGLYASRNAHGERLKTLLILHPPSRQEQERATDVFTVDLCSLEVPMNWALSMNARKIVRDLLEPHDVSGLPCDRQNFQDLDCIKNRLGDQSKVCPEKEVAPKISQRS
ncbi:hypothetical protein ACU8OQ_25745 (plasmid) [Rhizobium leguminosarum]